MKVLVGSHCFLELGVLFQAHVLFDWIQLFIIIGRRFLFPCWSSTRSCPQLLEAVTISCHVAFSTVWQFTSSWIAREHLLQLRISDFSCLICKPLFRRTSQSRSGPLTLKKGCIQCVCNLGANLGFFLPHSLDFLFLRNHCLPQSCEGFSNFF